MLNWCSSLHFMPSQLSTAVEESWEIAHWLMMRRLPVLLHRFLNMWSTYIVLCSCNMILFVAFSNCRGSCFMEVKKSAWARELQVSLKPMQEGYTSVLCLQHSALVIRMHKIFYFSKWGAACTLITGYKLKQQGRLLYSRLKLQLKVKNSHIHCGVVPPVITNSSEEKSANSQELLRAACFLHVSPFAICPVPSFTCLGTM